MPDAPEEPLVDVPILQEPQTPAQAVAVPYSPGRFSNVHLTMGSVVTGGMDEEELDGTRVGFSSRTQKMESLLRQEMKPNGLSYNGLVDTQAKHSRHLTAACFFELLVLKTNGIIEVSQADPYTDITISEGHRWSSFDILGNHA